MFGAEIVGDLPDTEGTVLFFGDSANLLVPNYIS